MPIQDTIAAIEGNEPDLLNDEQLFRRLYERYFEMVFRSALYSCGTIELAEDAAQDVFLKVWMNIKSLRLKTKTWGSWHMYLFVTAGNRGQNLMRSKNVCGIAIDGHAETLSEAVYCDMVLEKECDKIFENAVDNLSRQQREMFVLRYYRFTRKVIAKELNLKPKTVTNTLMAARKILIEHVYKQWQ